MLCLNILDAITTDGLWPCIQQNNTVLLYAATTFNTPDPSILTSDITSSRTRERLKFLINKLGMRSMSLETLKKLADEKEE
ncbi:hypothetical protein Tco_1461357 [Tanacetum coccineum]